MKERRRNPNKGIMLGIMAMAIVVLAVVVVFWLWCFPDGAREAGGGQMHYRVVLAEGFRADSILLQVNDSVVWAQWVEADSVEVPLAVPGEGGLLMVVRPEADWVNTFELPREGGRLVLRKRDGMVEMDAF